MSPHRRILLPGLRPALLLAILLASASAAEPESHITCTAPWARATTSDAPTGAVYLGLVNAGEQDRQLMSVTCPDADHVELHVHRVDEQGVMHMEQLPRLTIPAHGSLVLMPGAAHLMLIGLHHGLVKGQEITLCLSFSDGQRTITARVAGAGATGPND